MNGDLRKKMDIMNGDLRKKMDITNGDFVKYYIKCIKS